MTESPADAPDILAFTPVPLARARHDGWTPDRQRRFIEGLAQIGLVSAAARAVGKSATSAYNLRARPGAESFAAAWDRAVAIGAESADSTAIDRAIEGEETPVFYRGRQVGTRTRYNDRLLIAALRRFGPRKTEAFSRDVAATLTTYLDEIFPEPRAPNA